MSFLDPWTPANGVTYRRAISPSQVEAAAAFVDAQFIADGSATDPGCPPELADITRAFLAAHEVHYFYGEDEDGICVALAMAVVDGGLRLAASGLAARSQSDSTIYEYAIRSVVRFMDWGEGDTVVVTSKQDAYLGIVQAMFGDDLSMAESTADLSFIQWEGTPPDFYNYTVQIRDAFIQEMRAL